MNELEALITTYRRQSGQQPLFLATVVETAGSTYRRPGARLLLTPEGELTGLISGGCLENDLVQHLRQRQTALDSPFVITYDLTADQDLLWGFGLGCNGTVRVLVESLNPANGQHLMAFLEQGWQQRQVTVVATVFDVESTAPALPNVQPGDRLLLQDQHLHHTLPEPLFALVLPDAQAALQQDAATRIHRYRYEAGWVKVCLEVLHPPPSLLIFGAGADAVPGVTLAKLLGWHVTVVDCRALEATYQRFSMADRVLLTRREILERQLSLTPETLALVMTHHYEDDLAILKFLFNASPAYTPGYIGLLGSRQRSQRLLQDYQNRHSVLSADQLQRLHFPVGLDIGAETPAEIALAILAEMQAVLTRRKGGFLKDRTGSIHAVLTNRT